MKAIKFAIFTLALSTILPLSNARAAFFSPYAELYTVGSTGSTTAQSNFTLNQNPVLYLELYSTPPTNTSLLVQNDSFTVQSPTTTYNPTSSSTTNQFWFSYTNTVWDSIKTVGTWTVTAESVGTSANAESFLGSTTFKVNAAPEPVGTVLFLTGALIMGIGILRRRKAIAV